MSKNGSDGTPAKEEKPPRRKRDHRAEFLIALAESGVVAQALKESGWNRTSAYRHRHDDAQFREAWDEAIDVAVEVAEAELYRRSTVGVEKPVFYQGQQVSTVREYSDNLLMFRLKALRPEKYRDPVSNTNLVINDERMGTDPDVAAAMLRAADQLDAANERAARDRGEPPAPRPPHLYRDA